MGYLVVTINERIPICLVVGSDKLDTIARKYDGNASELLEKCRRVSKKHTRIHTSESKIVVAFQALHELGEIELHIQRIVNGVKEFRVDVNGEIIEPWPDEFFEIEFNLRFHADTL
jgi:hypothetical protein